MHVGEELADGAFNPTLKRDRRERTTQAGAAQPNFDGITFHCHQFNRAAMVILNIAVQRFYQAADLFFNWKIGYINHFILLILSLGLTSALRQDIHDLCMAAAQPFRD